MVLDDCDSPLGRAGGLAVYPLATLWLLVGMAFVAEEYFSVALEGIVEKYHVPDAVAGATVLAVAMVVARKGQATAAVSTALGSNVFDILIALGLPWAIYASAYGPVHIAHAFELTLLMALSTVVFLIISLTNAWTYTARHGYFLLVLYFLFNVYVVLDAIPQTNVPGPSDI